MRTKQDFMGAEFDEWLNRELDKGFAALSAQPVPAEPSYRQVAAAPGLRGRIIGSRFFAPVIGAALIASGGTAVAAAATGTNPVEFGQHVSQAVVDCKEDVTTGERGIGDCVSDFVLSRAPDADGQTAPVSSDRTAGRGERARTRPLSSPTASPTAVTPDSHGSAVSDFARSTSRGEDRGDSASDGARNNAPGQQGRDDESSNSGRGGPAADERGSDNRGSDARGSDARGSDVRGSDVRGSDVRGSSDRGSSDGAVIDPGSDGRGSSDRGGEFGGDGRDQAVPRAGSTSGQGRSTPGPLGERAGSSGSDESSSRGRSNSR